MKKMLSSMALATVLGLAFAHTNFIQTSQEGMPSQEPAQTTTVVMPDSITTFVVDRNMSWEEAAALVALARNLNADPNLLRQAKGDKPESFYDLAPAFIIQQQSYRSFDDIYQMYKDGKTWQQIASDLNVSSANFNPAYTDTSTWTNDDFTRGTWQAILQNRYNLTADDVTYFNDNNVPMAQIVVAKVIAEQDGMPVRDVVMAYNATYDWAMVEKNLAEANTTSQMPATDITYPDGQPIMQEPTTTLQEPMVVPAEPMDQTDMNYDEDDTLMIPDHHVTNEEVYPFVVDDSTIVQQPEEPMNTETTTTTSTLVQENVQHDPIEEWQIGGGDIVAYNPTYAFAPNMSSTTTSYALHRHKVKKHRR